MKKLTWNEAQKTIEENAGIIFLEFTTTWCGDCKMMKPFVSELEKHFEDEPNVEFIEVDAEQANLFRKETTFKVGKVPSFYVINHGDIKHIGYEFQPFEKLKKAIENEI